MAHGTSVGAAVRPVSLLAAHSLHDGCQLMTVDSAPQAHLRLSEMEAAARRRCAGPCTVRAKDQGLLR